MKDLSHLLFKFTVSSMIVSAPAMISAGNNTESKYTAAASKGMALPYNSSDVIKKFITYNSFASSSVNTADKEMAARSAKEIKELAHRVEVKMLINQAIQMYDSMGLARAGLDEEAFEYAWRGYHNLLNKGLIRKKNVLSICDFSQSSSRKRMYIIDVLHKRLLYRTYVAHGQNSGSEFATSFSNEQNSFKSSLGFYLTSRTYYGRNGLSLKIEGMDTGYNDLARKRNIVLHGCTYVGPAQLHKYGSLGTSLGCPAIPAGMSPQIIRAVRHGSCFFIYHPTKKYLEGSSILNG
jgi:L,D-transpeptidase catalytic domain